MTMNINLTPHLEDMVRQKVASGLYASASEVIREALRLMEEHDRTRAVKLEQLRQDIRDGLENGEPTSWNPKEIKQEAREKRATGSAGKDESGYDDVLSAAAETKKGHDLNNAIQSWHHERDTDRR